MLASLGLALFGVAAIWGASLDNAAIYHKKQMQWLVVGLAAMIALAAVDHRWSKRTAWLLYLGLIGLLLLVLVTGSRVNGSKSWFILPLGGGRKIAFQPAEPGKVIVVIMLARYLSSRMLTFRRFVDAIAPMAILAVPVGLILKQPDFGTAMIFLPTAAAMFFVAGLNKRVFVAFGLAAVAAAYLGYPHLKQYQKERIQTFLNPGQDALGKGYNVIQAQTALGSGEMFGKGWGKGTQTNFRFLPEYQTDFVFPTLGEQFGFAGDLAVLALYAIILGRMTYLAGRTQDLYGALLVTGLAAVLMVHLILNIGMATGLLPVTGVPLPFLSYGGSFLLTCFIMIGLSVSVGIRRDA